ncbi:MAG: hypothetical protein PHH37_14215 [Paludibacter sp.]|nr:hypothetical protein [Paludibacter sp.]
MERQKSSLEQQVQISEEKSIIFDMMIDLVEKEFKFQSEKKSLPGQTDSTQANGKNQ